MERDRRSTPRVRVSLPARWEGVVGRESATITDLSRTGCFVLSGGHVDLKELLWLQISLPDQPPVHMWAEVVDVAYQIGFAVRFNSTSTENDRERLAAFIASVFKSNPRTKR